MDSVLCYAVSVNLLIGSSLAMLVGIEAWQLVHGAGNGPMPDWFVAGIIALQAYVALALLLGDRLK